MSCSYSVTFYGLIFTLTNRVWEVWLRRTNNRSRTYRRWREFWTSVTRWNTLTSYYLLKQLRRYIAIYQTINDCQFGVLMPLAHIQMCSLQAWELSPRRKKNNENQKTKKTHSNKTNGKRPIISGMSGPDWRKKKFELNIHDGSFTSDLIDQIYCNGWSGLYDCQYHCW